LAQLPCTRPLDAERETLVPMPALSNGSARQASTAERRRAFADQFRVELERTGWSLTETARRASQHLPNGRSLSYAHLWHYLHGRAVPRAANLEALAHAFGTDPRHLHSDYEPEPAGAAAASAGERQAQYEATPALEGLVRLQDCGDGTALLVIKERIPWRTAVEVLSLLTPVRG
jgi:transcriptional regulator with XRE-family HTH domain